MDWLQLPWVQGAVTGFVTAASVDYAAFRSFKRWDDVAAYDWRVALFRWANGVIVGILSGFGIGLAG